MSNEYEVMRAEIRRLHGVCRQMRREHEEQITALEATHAAPATHITHDSQTPVPESPAPKITTRQFGLIVGRKAVAALLGEVDPISFDRADLHTAKTILGELLAETEAGFEGVTL